MVNEIIKSYKNNNKKPNFYYYRDIDQKEIDLVIQEDGELHFVECKSGVSYSKKDISAFSTLTKKTKYKVASGAVISATDVVYTIDTDVFGLPFGSI